MYSLFVTGLTGDYDQAQLPSGNRNRGLQMPYNMNGSPSSNQPLLSAALMHANYNMQLLPQIMYSQMFGTPSPFVGEMPANLHHLASIHSQQFFQNIIVAANSRRTIDDSLGRTNANAIGNGSVRMPNLAPILRPGDAPSPARRRRRRSPPMASIPVNTANSPIASSTASVYELNTSPESYSSVSPESQTVSAEVTSYSPENHVVLPEAAPVEELPIQSVTSTEAKKSEKPEKIFKCKICLRCFGYKHVLQNHTRTHTGEKPFQCKECGKKFTRDHHLKTHSRLHTGEKPFHCHFCERSFVQVANLRRHLRVHTGERPYQCMICNASFSDSNQLKAHKNTHIQTADENPEETVFRCPHCQLTFSQNSLFRNHSCSSSSSTSTDSFSSNSTDEERRSPDFNQSIEDSPFRTSAAVPELMSASVYLRLTAIGNQIGTDGISPNGFSHLDDGSSASRLQMINYGASTSGFQAINHGASTSGTQMMESESSDSSDNASTGNVRMHASSSNPNYPEQTEPEDLSLRSRSKN